MDRRLNRSTSATRPGTAERWCHRITLLFTAPGGTCRLTMEGTGTDGRMVTRRVLRGVLTPGGASPTVSGTRGVLTTILPHMAITARLRRQTSTGNGVMWLTRGPEQPGQILTLAMSVR